MYMCVLCVYVSLNASCHLLIWIILPYVTMLSTEYQFVDLTVDGIPEEKKLKLKFITTFQTRSTHVLFCSPKKTVCVFYKYCHHES